MGNIQSTSKNGCHKVSFEVGRKIVKLYIKLNIILSLNYHVLFVINNQKLYIIFFLK